MQQHIIWLSYLVASVLFIIGLKMLSHPESARKGNLWAAAGMGLAILVTLTDSGIHNHFWIIAAFVIGAIIGTVSAKKVKMTAMPQMVSFFNGMGGACVAVIGIIEFSSLSAQDGIIYSGEVIEEKIVEGGMLSGYVLTILVGLIIGSVSFSGSMIAMGKLQGFVTEKSVSWPLQRFTNMFLLVAVLCLGGYIMSFEYNHVMLLYTLFGLALLYGVLFVLPIGGADMPVVISLLNSFTGVAAACAGFLYDNQVMLTGGILVGSAGTILTVLMCKAMNRSLLNVIIGSFGGGAISAGGTDEEKTVREISVTDAAILMSYSKKVVIIPGYGLAVAQAQHLCHDLDKLLEDKGVDVKYAIHPVAGRMPGHMNVLLAEADVPYDKLKEMEEINAEFSNTDVALVIGANDVVNPAANNDEKSPIYGMPILEAENAKNIIVMKRSMAAGYAGIENELFFNQKTSMLFGDAKSSLEKLVSDIKLN